MSLTQAFIALPPRVEEKHPKDVSLNAEPTFYKLPDTLHNWPYERSINPYYHVGKAESVAWLEGFKPFSPTAQKVFATGDFSLLAALAFPTASEDVFRSCCDLMHTFFTLDDSTDSLSTENAAAYCEATMDAILHPAKPRPKDEPIIGEITRQFWKHASAYAPRAAQERFIKTWRAFLDSVITQASRRDMPHPICTVAEYMDTRYDNIGTYPSFVFIEMSLKVDIPHHVMEHPTMATLNRHATAMILLANDIYSYKKEVLSNDAAYNAITVVMNSNRVDLDGAVQWISNLHDELVENFLILRDEVRKKIKFPSYGEALDRQIEMYIDGLAQWIRGHDEWSFGSCRYFGEDGLHIQKLRRVFISL